MAKVNGNLKWIAVLTPFILLGIAAIAAFATNRSKTETNARDIEKTEVRLDKDVCPRLRKCEKDDARQMAILERIEDYIKEGKE